MKPIQTKLVQIANFYNGAEASFIDDGEYIIYGSNGPIGSSINFNNENAIIMGRVGAYCGSIEIEKSKFWASDNTIVVKPKSDNNLEYLYYLLINTPLRSYAGGAAQPLLTHTILRAINLKFFRDPKYQILIADILSTYDDLINTNRRRIQLLEEAARLLFREWFVYFRFPGHEKVKIVDSVPEGWRFAKVKDLGQIVTGKTPSKKNIRNFDGNVPFIKTPDMHQSWIILNTEETLSEIGASLQNNKYLPPWSVLVSCIGTVGVVAMNLFKSQTNQQINSVIPKNKFYRYYSFFCLSNIKPLLEAIGGGSTMTNINKNKFENIKIIIPSENVLAEFYQTVNPIFNQMSLLIDQNQKLAQARDLLLPRLMSGEIDPIRYDELSNGVEV